MEQTKRVKRQRRTDVAGKSLSLLRRGNNLMLISGGKNTIAAGERTNLAKVIETVIAATRDRELDAAIERAEAMPQKLEKEAA